MNISALLLALAPVLGFMMNRLVPWKLNLALFAVALAAWLPEIVGYRPALGALQTPLFVAVLATGFACVLEIFQRRAFKLVVAAAMAILIGLAGIAFLTRHALAPNQFVIESAHIGKYRVDTVHFAGFGGGGVRYELHEYALLDLYEREVDTAARSSATKCTVVFEEARVRVDLCTKEVMQGLEGPD